MLKIMSEGDGKFRLVDSAGTAIGWISGCAIGFRGFATESDAREGAVAAWGALDLALSNHFAGWPRRDIKPGKLHLTHDGAYEWFCHGRVPIARLLRPQRRAYDSSFGIELILPSYATEGVAVATAQSVAPAVAPFRDDRRPASVRPATRSRSAKIARPEIQDVMAHTGGAA
jgi:hypothetical protein